MPPNPNHPHTPCGSGRKLRKSLSPEWGYDGAGGAGYNDGPDFPGGGGVPDGGNGNGAWPAESDRDAPLFAATADGTFERWLPGDPAPPTRRVYTSRRMNDEEKYEPGGTYVYLPPPLGGEGRGQSTTDQNMMTTGSGSVADGTPDVIDAAAFRSWWYKPGTLVKELEDQLSSIGINGCFFIRKTLRVKHGFILFHLVNLVVHEWLMVTDRKGVGLKRSARRFATLSNFVRHYARKDRRTELHIPLRLKIEKPNLPLLPKQPEDWGTVALFDFHPNVEVNPPTTEPLPQPHPVPYPVPYLVPYSVPHSQPGAPQPAKQPTVNVYINDGRCSDPEEPVLSDEEEVFVEQMTTTEIVYTYEELGETGAEQNNLVPVEQMTTTEIVYNYEELGETGAEQENLVPDITLVPGSGYGVTEEDAYQAAYPLHQVHQTRQQEHHINVKTLNAYEQQFATTEAAGIPPLEGNGNALLAELRETGGRPGPASAEWDEPRPTNTDADKDGIAVSPPPRELPRPSDNFDAEAEHSEASEASFAAAEAAEDATIRRRRDRRAQEALEARQEAQRQRERVAQEADEEAQRAREVQLADEEANAERRRANLAKANAGEAAAERKRKENAQTKKVRPNDPAQWSSEEVFDCLVESELEEVGNVFKKKDVRGDELLVLTRDELDEMAIRDEGDIAAVVTLIGKLKQKCVRACTSSGTRSLGLDTESDGADEGSGKALLRSLGLDTESDGADEGSGKAQQLIAAERRVMGQQILLSERSGQSRRRTKFIHEQSSNGNISIWATFGSDCVRDRVQMERIAPMLAHRTKSSSQAPLKQRRIESNWTNAEVRHWLKVQLGVSSVPDLPADSGKTTAQRLLSVESREDLKRALTKEGSLNFSELWPDLQDDGIETLWQLIQAPYGLPTESRTAEQAASVPTELSSTMQLEEIQSWFRYVGGHEMNEGLLGPDIGYCSAEYIQRAMEIADPDERQKLLSQIHHRTTPLHPNWEQFVVSAWCRARGFEVMADVVSETSLQGIDLLTADFAGLAAAAGRELSVDELGGLTTAVEMAYRLTVAAAKAAVSHPDLSWSNADLVAYFALNDCQVAAARVETEGTDGLSLFAMIDNRQMIRLGIADEAIEGTLRDAVEMTHRAERVVDERSTAAEVAGWKEELDQSVNEGGLPGRPRFSTTAQSSTTTAATRLSKKEKGGRSKKDRKSPSKKKPKSPSKARGIPVNSPTAFKF